MTGALTIPPAGPPPSATATFYRCHIADLAAGRLKKPAPALDPIKVPAIEAAILKVLADFTIVGCGMFHEYVRARHRHIHLVLSRLCASGAVVRRFTPIIVNGAVFFHMPLYSLASRARFFKDAGPHPIRWSHDRPLADAEDFCQACWCWGFDGEIAQLPTKKTLADEQADQPQLLEPTDHFLDPDQVSQPSPSSDDWTRRAEARL